MYHHSKTLIDRMILGQQTFDRDGDFPPTSIVVPSLSGPLSRMYAYSPSLPALVLLLYLPLTTSEGGTIAFPRQYPKPISLLRRTTWTRGVWSADHGAIEQNQNAKILELSSTKYSHSCPCQNVV